MNESKRIAYVLKRYPRYSETFIVNEILAHEAAGVEIEIFTILPPHDSHFQDLISRVRAPVNYLPKTETKAINFWKALKETSQVFPDMWGTLKAAAGEDTLKTAVVEDTLDLYHAFVYHALIVAQQARLKGISHFHAHFGTSATAVARIASLISGIPYTFTAHAKDIFHESVRADDLRRKLQDAAAVITVSDYNRDYLVSQFGSTAMRVQRIYNGLPLQDFPYQAGQERAPRIVFVGRLVEKKGVNYLIEACEKLVSRGLEFECKIIGSGDLEVELRAQIDRLGLSERVELLGLRPQKEVKRLMQSAMVLAAPCVVAEDDNRDGLPTVLVEAMALGTPCVSTEVTGIPEVLVNGKTGLLVPERNASELAAALELLLTDASLRVRLAAQARQLVEEKFDISRNAACMRKVFDTARRKRGRARELKAA
jgi:glycosyltransferase involved in cell wall biosynthesis